MIDANLIRICKLALISGAAAVCAAGTAFLVHGNSRQLAAGVAAGLTFAAATTRVEAYRRRGPVDTSPTAKEKKLQRARTIALIGSLLGGIALIAIRLLHIELLVAGFGGGIAAFAGLWFSPLFWTRPSPRQDTSPRARMTSAERAVSVRYE